MSARYQWIGCCLPRCFPIKHICCWFFFEPHPIQLEQYFANDITSHRFNSISCMAFYINLCIGNQCEKLIMTFIHFRWSFKLSSSIHRIERDRFNLRFWYNISDESNFSVRINQLWHYMVFWSVSQSHVSAKTTH